MSLRLLASGFVALGVALLIVSPASAQLQRNRNPGMQMQPIKTGGTFIAGAQNQIQLSTNQGQTIYVVVRNDTQVSVTGTAEQDYLKSGVTVEFVGEVDKTHTVKDKITHLLIVSPTTDRPVGLFPPEFATAKKKPAEDGEEEPQQAMPLGPDPGIQEAAPARGHKARGKKDADAFGTDLFDNKPAKAKKGAAQFPGTFTVRGTIKMCKDGKITVAAGRGGTAKAELANDVTIDVDMADLHAVQRDDRVTVNGFTNQAHPNMVLAESIKVELANPLSGVKKRATRPTKTPATRTSKAKKAADGDDLLGSGK